MKFKTHTGEFVEGNRLRKALDRVADNWANNARAIRESGDYASHVSECTKDRLLLEALEYAQDIKDGKVFTFTVWQSVNVELTGECVGYLT